MYVYGITYMAIFDQPYTTMLHHGDGISWVMSIVLELCPKSLANSKGVSYVVKAVVYPLSIFYLANIP